MTPEKRPESEADKWLRIGDCNAEAAASSAKQAVQYAMKAGFAYLRVKAARPHGDWELLVESKGRVPLRTVQRWIQLATRNLEEAKKLNRDVTDPRKLEEIAMALRVMSPVPQHRSSTRASARFRMESNVRAARHHQNRSVLNERT